MRNIDWLPRNHEDLYDHLSQTWSYLKKHKNRSRMGLDGKIGVWLDTEFEAARKVFVAAFEVWKDKSKRTPRITEHLKKAEEKLKPLYITLYTGFLKENPFVTDEDLMAMNLPSRLEGNHPEATILLRSVPSVVIEQGSAGVLIIHFRDGEDRNRVKPRGIHAVEVCWAILDKAPTELSQLTNTSSDTRTPIRFTFDPDKRGKKFYCALRWENIRGEKSTWSIIYSASIP
ncbi:MAG: hypothetical protein LBE13_00515 [Bacteroidales bacterium]|jgi:hypothetical protein|nr:hypothetical protein [Bacteroidales bacterium]